ncbi:hypothetical protein [Actinacidiphila oryziradicis]|uniref:Uncharacterized protein n=1 Tax=Actinacidiphila oryziradicis TaxID=2571141 RepID=A0A4U0RYK1_9ACTN|nr:hypothetical protein [Actinacidiphila oryziradicis]TJZ99900.1 hypothetical protein FCI23_44175 [Actinacidiphila oryziradicis]
MRPFGPLLTVNGSAARPFTALPVPAVTTPTPTPAEPVSRVTSTPSSAGWSVQGAPIIGKGDNTFGSVAAVSPTDVWAVGNYLPDAAGSNKDATLSMAAHYDGTRWTSTPTPNSGPNFNTLFGAAATPGRAWAVGVALDSQYQAHSLVEAWNGSAWKIAATPKLNTQRDILYSATAVSASDVWAVGEQQDRGGRFGTLIEHWNGTRWSVVPSPDPGSTGNQLYGVAAAGPDNVWAVGQRNDATTDRPLVEQRPFRPPLTELYGARWKPSDNNGMKEPSRQELPHSWGSWGRRFTSCRPNGVDAGHRPFSHSGGSFWL